MVEFYNRTGRGNDASWPGGAAAAGRMCFVFDGFEQFGSYI